MASDAKAFSNSIFCKNFLQKFAEFALVQAPFRSDPKTRTPVYRSRVNKPVTLFFADGDVGTTDHRCSFSTVYALVLSSMVGHFRAANPNA